MVMTPREGLIGVTVFLKITIGEGTRVLGQS